MSKWLPVFLCCFAANAFASSANSGRCPWKTPFTIKIHAVGSVHQYEQSFFPHVGPGGNDYGTHDSAVDFGITVDTTSHLQFENVRYSLNADTLRFSSDYGDLAGPCSTSILIALTPGQDSIISLTIRESDPGLDQLGSQHELYWQYTFQISALLFNDTSIYTTDSSSQAHNISMTDFYLDQYTNGIDAYDDNHSDFTASSVDLSGIFRPTHFADPSSVIEEVPPQTEALSVTSFNGALRCSFGASPQERLLEIYSSLGIRTASCTVSAGQTEAVIPRIAPGFYLVRLGNTLAKVFVAE